MTVLIVEDNPTNAMVLKHMISKVTHEDIMIETDGAGALAQCHGQMFSMLIVDQMLPGMSGLQFAKAVRLMGRYDSVPIVMVTADQVPELRQEAAMAGITAFLTKPIEVVGFRKLLADYLGGASTNLAAAS